MTDSRDPSRARPLSANVKRLMRLARASPPSAGVVKMARPSSERDLVYCRKQGDIFMEAASMGLSMEDFAPRFMTSQLAGVFDVSFASSQGIENDELSNLLRVPLLLKSPGAVVEALYWIDGIVAGAKEGVNRSLLVTEAYEDDSPRLPAELEKPPDEPNRNVDELSYAFWLGYIYRCECLLHEESSRMVYGAFNEEVMRGAYAELLKSPLGRYDLEDSAVQICAGLDRLLVERIWAPAKKKARRDSSAGKHDDKGDISPVPGADAASGGAYERGETGGEASVRGGELQL